MFIKRYLVEQKSSAHIMFLDLCLHCCYIVDGRHTASRQLSGCPPKNTCNICGERGK